MYANLRGAKIFTTLDLQSGYYHIDLDNESKAKTAFVTLFGKYEFNVVHFSLAQDPAALPTNNINCIAGMIVTSQWPT